MDRMRADTDLRRAQLGLEPWKAMALAFTAGGIVFGPLGGIIGYVLGTAAACH